MLPIILNQSDGNWVFADLAQMLSRSLWIDISDRPGDLNYILGADSTLVAELPHSFIPLNAIEIAADKRAIERQFQIHNVNRPKTFIVETIAAVDSILTTYPHSRWILKYPTGCGGINHRIINDTSEIPANWPQPYLIQEFIESLQPAVYRFYCVASELFGFNVRKFADPEISTPWVSHANGARYSYPAQPDRSAKDVAKAALIATGLFDSFGVVDLVKDLHDRWYALEVGTDGIYNHVDRDFANDDLLNELNERLAIAFWQRIGMPPWGKTWKYA